MPSRSFAVMIAVLMCVTIHPVNTTTVLPLPTLSFTPFEYSQPLRTFSFDEANINVNQEVLGITLQIALEDCTQGSRWFLRPLQYMATLRRINTTALYGGASALFGSIDPAWEGLDVTYDPTLCAVFVFRGNATSTSSSWSSSTATSTSVATLLQAVRTLWFYNAAAAVVSNPSRSLRVAWSYWMGGPDLGGFAISFADTQHMVSCLDRSATTLNYGSAVTACQQWLQDTADPSSIGASLVSIGSYTAQAMVQSVRQRVSAQYTDPSTGSLVGYVSLIGLYGTRSSWDNGASLTYRNFAQANPVGNFPTVMDQDGLWKSVLAADPYPYCCETTASGPPQEVANGFVTIVSNATETASAELIPGATLAVVKSTKDLYFDAFFPFELSSAVVDAVSRSASATMENVFGFTASFHREDCDGSFRFVLSSSFPNATAVAVTFQDDLCSVTLTPTSFASAAQLPSWYLAAVANLKIIDIRGPSQVAAATASGVSVTKRLVWGFLLGDGQTAWAMGGSPVPHYYYCSWGSANFADASIACANRSGVRQEGYLATPQYAWEQELLEDLLSHGNLTYDSVWIGLDTALGSSVFSNGDPMITNGFSQWGVNQPSLSDAPAALSGINAEWASRSRVSTLSYCCEMTSVVSRNMSGVVYTTLSSSASAPQRSGAIDESLVAVDVAQQLRLFRPFADIRHRVSSTLWNATVYGVSFQLPIENCTTAHAPSGASRPLLAVTVALSSPYSLCPAQPGSGVSGTAAAGCSNEKDELMQQRAALCSWTLSRTDSSATAINASELLAIMEGLELRVARLPLDTFKTSDAKGRWDQPLHLSWAFWYNPPTLTLPTTELPISNSVVFRGAAAAWPAKRMVVSSNSGAMFLCPSPHALGDTGGMISSTFTDALTICRDWADDAYLATVASGEELTLLMLARNLSFYGNVTSNVASTAPPAMWIALQRNRSSWMNGDPVTFSNWASGEPSNIGPTQVDGGSNGGLWRNVPILVTGTATQQTATFCCKRNGYNQQTARLTGIVSIEAETISVSNTITDPTFSDEASISVATAKATVTPALSLSRNDTSVSGSTSLSVATLSRNIAGSVTDTGSRQDTTSAQLTTPPPTSTATLTVAVDTASPSITPTRRWTNITLEDTASRADVTISTSNPTLTLTMPLPAVARIDWELPLIPRFTAADIRSGDPARRRITLESVFTVFVPVLNGSTTALVPLSSLVSMSVSPSSPSLSAPSPKDFLHTGASAAWLAASSTSTIDPTIGAELSSLTITIAQVKDYFPGANEALVMRINRNATTMVATQLPATIPTLSFTIIADDPATDASVGAKSVETVFAVLSLAAPTAFRDVQFMSLLGGGGGGAASTCSRTQQRVLYLDGIRVVSPVHWSSSSYLSLWVGASALLFAVAVCHFAAWIVHAGAAARRAAVERRTRQQNEQMNTHFENDFDELDDEDPFATINITSRIQQQQRGHPRHSVSQESHPSPAVPSSVVLRFPSFTILAVRVFLVSIVAHSIWTLMSSQGPADAFDRTSVEFALGVFGLAIVGTITVAVLFWATCLRGCAGEFVVFVEVPEKVMRAQTATTKWLAPSGSWIPADLHQATSLHKRRNVPASVDKIPPYDASQSFFWLCGEYRTLWWVLVDWTLPWLMGWVVTYSPSDNQLDSCTQVYGAISAILFLIAVVMLLLRPLASPIANYLAAISYALLAAITICLVMQLEDPDGRSKDALDVLRWVLLVTGLLRSFVVLLSFQLAIDPHQRRDHITNANFGGDYALAAASQQRHPDDFFAVRRRSSAYALMSPNGSQRRSMVPPQQVQEFHFGGAGTPMFAASHGRNQRKSFIRSPTADGTSSGGRFEDDDVDPLMLMEMYQQQNQESGGDHYKRGASFGGFVFPVDDNPGNHDTRNGGGDPTQRRRESSPNGGAVDRQRMFSVGSMRRFGSMRGRLSNAHITVGTVDSEGESSDEGGVGEISHHQRASDPQPQRKVPVVQPNQHERSYNNARSQPAANSPPHQLDVHAQQQYHHQQYSPTSASPNVAMRLSGLFQSPINASSSNSPRDSSRGQQQSREATTAAVADRRRQSDPFADIPFATEQSITTMQQQQQHQRQASGRFARFDSILGDS